MKGALVAVRPAGVDAVRVKTPDALPTVVTTHPEKLTKPRLGLPGDGEHPDRLPVLPEMLLRVKEMGERSLASGPPPTITSIIGCAVFTVSVLPNGMPLMPEPGCCAGCLAKMMDVAVPVFAVAFVLLSG